MGLNWRRSHCNEYEEDFLDHPSWETFEWLLKESVEFLTISVFYYCVANHLKIWVASNGNHFIAYESVSYIQGRRAYCFAPCDLTWLGDPTWVHSHTWASLLAVSWDISVLLHEFWHSLGLSSFINQNQAPFTWWLVSKVAIMEAAGPLKAWAWAC